ncbi:BTAD domain-containing putative transcriptional regulator [Sphaerisporangium dianthi]|uniref:BTAD domain-containing putative transcriptional regulator n=1 Tax=Sphaerisporangium dianthi TaxID=1436120 RepID=A0ABV9CUC4_9ACTN
MDPSELDAEVFAQMCASAQEEHAAGDLNDAVRLYDKALALWHGDAYSGVPGPFADMERARLLEVKLRTSELRAEAMLALGHHGAVVANLVALTSVHPLREKLRALLMLTLYRCGRQADALRVFRETRALLVRELGIEPGPELRYLNDRILANDVTLNMVTQPRSHPWHPAGAVSPRPVPAQLPQAIRGFVGRTQEVAALRRSLARDDVLARGEPPAVAIIHGIAGAGKTALAVHVAHSVARDYPDGQLFIDLHGFDPACAPVSAFDALGYMLRSLGVTARSMPSDLDDRVATYRSLLSGRRVLLVLDNAANADQVRPLLPGTSSCQVIVTSRNQLTGLSVREGARCIQLSLFSPDDSLRLMSAMLGPERVAEELAASRELAHLCGHLPLAVRIAAEPLAGDRRMAVMRVVQGLRDERRRLDLLAVEGDDSATLRTVFSCSYQAMPAEAARVFRMLGRHADVGIHPDKTALLCGIPVAEALRALRILSNAHLLEQHHEHSYHLHELLRLYARECAEASEPGAGVLAGTFPYGLVSADN